METTAEKQQAAAPASKATDPEKQGAATADATSKTAPRRCWGGDDEAQAQQSAALKWQKLAEGDKAEAGKAKRIGRVSQRYIDILLREKATATGAYRPSRSMEYLAMYKGPHEAELRALVERSNAARERVRAGDAAILEQYHRLGYAYSEMEED